MTVHAGPRWVGGEPREWYARVEDHRIVDEGPGPAPAPAEPAVFLEGIRNGHTHLGDAFLAGRQLPRDLDRLVRPRTGLKHVELERADRETLVGAMAAALQEQWRTGAEELWDFREQGPQGLILAREALRRAGPQVPRVRLLARPAQLPASPHELAALWHLADGLGLPSLTDWGAAVCRALADAAHANRKWVALHLSEGRREPVADALALGPHLAIHLCQATDGDLASLKDAGVVAVLCPSSNEFFRLRTPLKGVQRAGLDWMLGTDNAMLGPRSVLGEARLLKAWHPDLPDDALLRALTLPVEKVINRIPVEHTPGGSRTLTMLPRNAAGGARWDAEPVVVHR